MVRLPERNFFTALLSFGVATGIYGTKFVRTKSWDGRKDCGEYRTRSRSGGSQEVRGTRSAAGTGCQC